MKTKKLGYYIARTGSNAANQSLTFKAVPIATLDIPGQRFSKKTDLKADSLKFKIAAEAHETVYNNQYLSAVRETEIKGKDIEEEEFTNFNLSDFE